jgi:ribosomal protein S18 acetylase RimI-like enzyme
MIIREYNPDDFQSIISDIPSSYLQRRKDQLKMVENCEPFFCYVAVDEEKIIGFVIFEDLGDGKSYYIVQISVAGKRKGIGTQLMNKVFKKIGKGSQVSLNVNTTNEAAIAFYKKLGFQKSGETKDYRKGEDKYWYQKCC